MTRQKLRIKKIWEARRENGKNERDHRAQQACKIKESSLCREACRDPDNLHRCGSHKESKSIS